MQYIFSFYLLSDKSRQRIIHTHDAKHDVVVYCIASSLSSDEGYDCIVDVFIVMLDVAICDVASIPRFPR